MYKKLSGIATLALMSLAHPVPLLAATETIDISATIVSSISVTEHESLNFGSIVTGPGGGSVTLDPMGSVLPAGDVASSGIQTPAMVTITAEPGMQLFTSTDSSVTLYSGTDTMTVNNFQIGDSTGGSSRLITLSMPSEDITIGATLQVGANQPPGVYTGTFTYTVDYQ